MTLLCLIRHGENTDGQVDGAGPTVDLGLSDPGRAQVERLCPRLAQDPIMRPTVLVASPERRAAETAERLASHLGLAVRYSKDLEEWRSDDGSMAPDAFMAQWRSLKETERAYHRFQPQSETQAEFFARVGTALHGLAAAHAGETVVVVTHGGFIQAAFRHFFGFGDASFRRAYPAARHSSITRWRLESGSDRWVLECSNDAHHLESLP